MDSAGDSYVALVRRQRRRKVAIGIAVAAVVVLGSGLSWALFAERKVTIAGPAESLIDVGDSGMVRFPHRVGLVRHLPPGEHAITSDDPAMRSSFTVPVFSRGVVVPAREDHCLVVASAAGAYHVEGAAVSDTPFAILERSTPTYSMPLLDVDVVTDPCSLPWEKKLLDSVYVAFAVKCTEAPEDDAAANDLLMAAMFDCGLR